ncbi:MAG: methyltransferase domain-containing protein [Chloroflexales bacterium]|nr:methyltransferase domain-containing protein [Chloroflexales bacterium]
MLTYAPQLTRALAASRIVYRRVVRRAFHHFYRELAWTYDTVAWAVSGGLWRAWALAALPELRGRTLELGFGTGHLQMALAARPAVAGLDASPQMAALAARRLRRAGHAPRLARGLAQALPFSAAAFDTVVATFPAEYIFDPRSHAEIRRVLAPGGRLVIVPFAQLAPGRYAGLVALAYRLTLQPPPRRDAAVEAELQRLTIAGIALAPRWVQVGPSHVMVLVGDG